MGWWNESASVRFNFRKAYEDRAMRANTEHRYGQSCKFLESGDVSLAAMMRHLRDHFEGGTVHVPDAASGTTRPRSVCLHPETWANGTAASTVIDVTLAPKYPIAWSSMKTPCTGVFVPVPVGTELPTEWSIAAGEPQAHSLWWAMQELAEAVQRDYANFTPLVQGEWTAWEAEMIRQVEADPAGAASQLQARTRELLSRRESLLAKLPVEAAATA
jgi:secernin